MILRTHLRTYLGLGSGLVHFGSFFAVGLGLVGLLFILTVGPQEVQCHCKGVHCVNTSQAKKFLYSAEPLNGHILRVRQVKPDDNVHSNLKSNEASNDSSSNTKFFMEGGGNDSPKLNSDPKTSDKHTALPPRPTVDSNSQLVPHTSNASTDQIPNEDFARSLYNLNTAALLRGFYVFGGLGAMVVMYILVRTIRLRRKKTTVRRYGVLTNREDLEMTPLGADDDEDTTIFEMSPHTRT